MKRNKIYTSLIEKSIGSIVSAIEIYNKPDFKYREETFAILAINAWELLFKARLLKLNGYKPNTIYAYKPYTNKDAWVCMYKEFYCDIETMATQK